MQKPAIIAHLAAVQALAIAGAEPPAEIMVFPAGSHLIHASRTDGTPFSGTVLVGPDTAQAMQAALLARQAEGGRPYFDFDHADERASAYPTAYRWEPGAAGKKPGVYASVEWSASGRAAVVGKDYTSFSPGFFIDEGNPARVVDAPLNQGGLVNAPAFTAQSPIWAKRTAISAATPTNNNTRPTTTMTEEEKKAADAAAAQAAAEAEKKKKEEEAAKAAADSSAAVSAKQTALENRLAAIEARAAAEGEATAKAAVQAAVNRGALPPKDEAIHAKWVGLIQADPSNAALLAGLPGRDVTQPVTSPGFAIEAKAGFVEELRGYSTEKSPVKRAAIWARHIAPMFKGGFSLGPILAANSLDTLAGDLVVQRAFSLLKLTYPWLFEITTDFTGENASFNQTIITRLKGPLTANAFVPGTGYGTNNASTSDVEITIDQHYGVPVTFNVNELASTTRDLFGEQAEGMHAALATVIITNLFAKITAANFTNATASTLAGFGRSTVTTMARKLSERKVGPTGRFLLLNPEFFEKLGQDSTIVQLAAYQRPELITEYRLPRVAGFNPHEAVSLPTAEDLVGFAGTSESLALATRVPNDYAKALPGANGGGVVTQVLNPETGITVQKVDYVDHVKAEATSRVALMFGTAVGNAATGERLTEAGVES